VVRRPPRQELLADKGQFIAPHVLKRELLPDAKGSPIDEKHVSPLFILDAEIIAPREQLLLHDVTQFSHLHSDSRSFPDWSFGRWSMLIGILLVT
jgi:hypothetical protein